MKRTSILFFSLVALAFGACSPNAGFEKTKSGLQYKIISDEKAPVVKKGEFLKVNFIQMIGDSVLNSSYDGLPTYAPVDSVGPIYNPVEIFRFLRKGDSAVVIMETDSLYKQQAERPPYVKKGDKLKLTFRVIDVMPNEQALRDDQMKLIDERKDKEVKAIQDYLAKNNITAQKTEKGTFVVITEPGTGPVADSGKAVHVKYTGRTFEGKPFDSNIDSSFGHTDPYVLVIGQRGAIEGWDDGLRLFNKGAKGKLYIPSMLAYGGNAMPGSPIKAFENLMFDIEVVDITDAPKQPAMPMPR